MSDKLVALCQGSVGDPDYDEQKITVIDLDNDEQKTILLPEYFHSNDIKTSKKVKSKDKYGKTILTHLPFSCHGNTELNLKRAKEIQKLADDNNKIVALFQGGLYFGLPSVTAANAPTVPCISIPLDGGS